MSFVNAEESPIEYYIIEVAELMAVREGLKRREAHLRILETLGDWIVYYEAGLSAKKSYSKFWGESV